MRGAGHFRSRQAERRDTPRTVGDSLLVNLRVMLVLLGGLAVVLLAQLLFAAGGYPKTVKLREAVAEQRAQNEDLRRRNAALDAEVINLKQGLEAAEERARTDLGLIGEAETFYQVVSVGDRAD